jgi:hypothetical protein
VRERNSLSLVFIFTLHSFLSLTSPSLLSLPSLLLPPSFSSPLPPLSLPPVFSPSLFLPLYLFYPPSFCSLPRPISVTDKDGLGCGCEDPSVCPCPSYHIMILSISRFCPLPFTSVFSYFIYLFFECFLSLPL